MSYDAKVVDRQEIDTDFDTKPFSLKDWVEAVPELFNMDEQYSEFVLPLVQAVEAKCRELGIPHHLRFITSQEENGSTCRSTCYTSGVNRVTPELLASLKMEQFNKEYILDMLMFHDACSRKFSKLFSKQGDFDAQPADDS